MGASVLTFLIFLWGMLTYFNSDDQKGSTFSFRIKGHDCKNADNEKNPSSCHYTMDYFQLPIVFFLSIIACKYTHQINHWIRRNEMEQIYLKKVQWSVFAAPVHWNGFGLVLLHICTGILNTGL